MALRYLTYEVSKPPRWNTFLAGLAIDALGVLLIIDVGAHLKNQVRLEPVATTHSVTLIAPAPAELARLTQPPPPRIVPVRPPVVAKLEAPKVAPRPVERPSADRPSRPKTRASKGCRGRARAPAGPPKPAPPGCERRRTSLALRDRRRRRCIARRVKCRPAASAIPTAFPARAIPTATPSPWPA